MIQLPDRLTAEGLVRRITGMKWAARVLAEAGRPLAETLEERCVQLEEHQRRLARLAEEWRPRP
jgi:hypothetical protein